MLKRILATIVIVSLAQVYAGQFAAEKKSMEQELAQAFDQLNYKLNVEWDQMDATFFNESVTEFETQISELQANDLSNEELVNFTMNRIKDKSSQEEVKAIVEAISANKMSSEEARQFAITKLNSTYSRGASWSGGKTGIKMALILAAVLVIVAISGNNGNPEPTPTPTFSPEPSPTPFPTPSPSPSYNPYPYPYPSPTYFPCMEGLVPCMPM